MVVVMVVLFGRGGHPGRREGGHGRRYRSVKLSRRMTAIAVGILTPELQRIIYGSLVQSPHKRRVRSQRAGLGVEHVRRRPADPQGAAGRVDKTPVASAVSPYGASRVVVMAVNLLIDAHGVVDGALRHVAIAVPPFHAHPPPAHSPVPGSVLLQATGALPETPRTA